jgi:glycosyltransferase involved in cell wall biosynthesis
MNQRQSLVVFSDDWGRHPSSCQHLIGRLLDRLDVTWVNTIGTRRPSLNMATIQRGFQKLSQWSAISSAESTEQHFYPRVMRPIMWPDFSSKWARRLNARLLEIHLRRNIERLQSSIILTTIPIVADLVGRFPVSRWVYYCVDDFSEWPGLDSESMRSMEQSLVQRVDDVIVAGENLAQRMSLQGRDSTILSHGVDLDHWRQVNALEGPLAFLTELERPLAVFWGLVDQRLDIQWLDHLNASLKSGTIALVGPQQNVDPSLRRMSRVKLMGAVPYGMLPQVASQADALIMPYTNSPVTRAMQPLKLKEYVATGKPVVVRRLPSTVPWEDCLDAVDSAEEFSRQVLIAFDHGVAPSQLAARSRLQFEDWGNKANQLFSKLTGAEVTQTCNPKLERLSIAHGN